MSDTVVVHLLKDWVGIQYTFQIPENYSNYHSSLYYNGKNPDFQSSLFVVNTNLPSNRFSSSIFFLSMVMAFFLTTRYFLYPMFPIRNFCPPFNLSVNASIMAFLVALSFLACRSLRHTIYRLLSAQKSLPR